MLRINPAARGVAAAFGAVAVFGVVGCGGSGSGSGGVTAGTPTPPATPTPTQTVPVRLAVNWAQRSRSVDAPGSAQSAVLEVPGGMPDGTNFQWTVNRDLSRSEPFSQEYVSSGENKGVKPGTHNAVLRFFSEPNGGGVVVGTASKANWDVSSDPNFGTVSVEGGIDQIVAADVAVPFNGSVPLPISFKSKDGSVIATPAGVQVVVADPSKAVFANGSVTGLAPGATTYTVTFGSLSATGNITVSSATVDAQVGAAGTRGLVPIQITNIAGAAGGILPVGEGGPQPVQLNAITTPSFIAPAGYGDRQFVKWQVGGADAGTSPTLTLPIAGITGPVVAVYEPRTAPAAGFGPNYNRSGNQFWGKFPVSVYIDPAAAPHQATILKGFSRWTAATGGFASYNVVGDPAQAQIVFRVTDDVPQGLVGLCQTTYFGDTRELVRAEIRVRPSVATQDGGSRLEVVSAHEYGHALGLTSELSGDDQGHSSDPNDTMFATANPQVSFTTERDVNSLSNLYAGLRGGSKAAPGGRGARVTRTSTVGCPTH